MHLLISHIKETCFLSFFCLSFFYVAAQIPNTARGVKITSENSEDSLTGTTYAIITGVSKYKGINPLKYADKDAILFRDFLKTPSGGYTKPENILSLINENAKAADFNVGAYSWLQTKKLKKGDRLYIYFSGHGDAMNEDLYFFLPYDCEPNKDDNNYLGTGNINLHTVKTLFIKPQVLKGVEVFLIMDACRTNELPGGKEGQQNFTNNFIAEQKMGDVILLSTGAGQVSIESPTIGNGHGLFTYYLVDGLAGAADKDSLMGDNNGRVSLSEISAYVKNIVKRRARTDFNTVQIPYYCCAEKDMATITKVDMDTYTAWENSKKLQEMSPDQNFFATNTIRQGERAISLNENMDTLQIAIYNQFTDAISNEKLIGESSAEKYYQILEQTWPGSRITEDAKFSLAAKYLNFCQQKINLFLSGKGLIHIVFMEKELNKEKKENDKTYFADLGEQIKKLKTLVTTGFDVANDMMEKAIVLLKNDSELIEPVLPKRAFLKTMSAYSNKSTETKDLIQLCRKAIASDPKSPAGYLLMGWIYQDILDDSCAYYFNKAATIAPKWAYPMNGLGNYYISRNNKKVALKYFHLAVSLDNLYSNAYRNLGMTYYNQKIFDSAKYFFKKAIDLDPCDSYANADYGSVNSDYISPEFGSIYTDSIYFNISKRYFLRSIACDSGFATGYQKLSALYSRANKEDSAFAILQKGVIINPHNAECIRNLGTFYLEKLKDTAQAEIQYKKAVALAPSIGDNYYSLARLYRKQKNKKKAIDIYTEALGRIGNNKDLFNELGNTYFEAPSEFEKSISYYNNALKIDSTLSYVYFNLGKLYGVKEETKDSSIYYYSKAVFYDPERFQKMNHNIADFYYDNKNFSQAKNYYQQSLSKYTFSRYADIEKLVNILIEEKNIAGAENILIEYLDPVSDKNQFTKISSAINLATEKQPALIQQ